MRLDETGRVVGFVEKPKTEEESTRPQRPGLDRRRGIVSRGRDYLASMGIYLFKRETLIELLEQSGYQTSARKSSRCDPRRTACKCYLFDGYWEDMGTIRSFTRRTWPSPAISRRSTSSRDRPDLHPRPLGSAGPLDAAAIHEALIADGW